MISCKALLYIFFLGLWPVWLTILLEFLVNLSGANNATKAEK